MGKVLVRASVRGARRSGFPLNAAGRRAQGILLDQMARLAPDLTRIGRAYAPHDTGRLERGLKASVRSYGGRITVQLLSSAVSDEGYPYTDVTRKGHRVAWIYPKPPRKALRFYWRKAGGIVYAKRVRGYRPSRDWVDPAYRAFDAEVSRAEDRIGRQIVSRLL